MCGIFMCKQEKQWGNHKDLTNGNKGGELGLKLSQLKTIYTSPMNKNPFLLIFSEIKSKHRIAIIIPLRAK